MTCHQLIDFLDDYLNDALPVRTRLAFGAHLLICGQCRRYLDSYRQTVELSRKAMADDAPVPESIPEELVQAILAAREK